MDDLIKSLTIFRSYMGKDVYAPTNCNHDEISLHVGVAVDDISKEHLAELDDLGWFWSDEHEGWLSFRYGSC